MNEPMTESESKLLKDLSLKFGRKDDFHDTVLCLYCGGPHFKRDCPEIICFRCKGLGHTSSGCRERRQTNSTYGDTICGICSTPRSAGSLCAARDTPLEKDELDEFTCMMCGAKGHLKCGGLEVTEWFIDNKCSECL
mmetsp:Transcript_2567/g.5839  ORF Transcript_2567/g.5839 Transcript_2567/m.5839 type:complete len:137 (+) Transcript_2567:110-520(+)